MLQGCELRVNMSAGGTYATVDTMMHWEEKETRLWRGCARLPIARIVVSESFELMVARVSGKGDVQAPIAPRTPIKATLELQVIF